MSWLFGGGKKPEDISGLVAGAGGLAGPPVPPAMGGGGGGGGGGKKSGGGGGGDGDGKSFGFQYEAFERAAAAMKDLDKSKNSKEAFALAKGQEYTKQLEQQTAAEQYKAATKQYEVQVVQAKGEETRKTNEQSFGLEKQKLDYRDKLERKQMSDKISAEKYMRDEERQKAEASAAKIEAMRAKTLEHEAELRQRTELARVAAETDGRIKQERENRDVMLEKARLEANEYRETVMKGIAALGDTVGDGINGFLDNPDRMWRVVGTLSALAVGIYAAKSSMGVAGRFVEARLGKPSLVRETSRRTGFGKLNPVPLVRGFLGGADGADALKGVVLEPELAARLEGVAKATANTRKHGAPFRNVLLHGPPGTGKTLFAKKLALHSGLEYAIMTGGDVAPLGRDAVLEMHKTFDWAEGSSKGLLLFVDEADAFLQKRNSVVMSEDARNALNAFLYRTGTQSSQVMVVFASNQPEQFDWAVLDRCDELVEFKLPGADERMNMLVMYLDQYVAEAHNQKSFGRAQRITLGEDVDAALLQELVEATDGFSGRQLAKMCIGMQSAAYASHGLNLSADMAREVLESTRVGYDAKLDWERQTTPGGVIVDVPAAEGGKGKSEK
jgi:ATPase family AAA domain-containing protein 3A/B